MPRVLGVDLGAVRVGLAVSDPGRVVAHPLDVVARADALGEIVRIANELGVDEIVVGIPLHLNGTRGPQAEAAEVFAAALQELAGLPVFRFDERLSTVEAERAMRTAGTRSRGQRGVVDKVAAAIVLQAYLESRRPQ